MNKKKLQLISTNLKSGSLKRLAKGLSQKLGYKVWRSQFTRLNRENLFYGNCKDKLSQYIWFSQQGINSLEFTTRKEEANSWLEEGHTVVARRLLRSSEGKGISVVEKNQTFLLPYAPVYTKYRKKKKEFRIHIFKDKVIHVLEKRKKIGVEHDSRIRNTANGYVFCSSNVIEPAGIRELALQASKVTNSDFKGVDIGWNEKKDELFVIEVNSAPGIEGSNITKYIETIVQ
jgi:glutathione synthase/RimK-type ligase-like ATP-grasp enzyme